MEELSIEKIEEIFKNNKVEEFINDLDEQKFTDFLLTLHSRFIKIEKKEDKIWDDYVGIGGMKGYLISLVAPNIELKKKMLANITEALKKIKNNRDRALLLHYLIIQIHFFSDGNGRLARSMLELFLNDTFNLDNELFYHKTQDSDETGKNMAWELEQKYQIKRIDRVLSYTSYIVSKILFDKHLIDNKIGIQKFTSASCSAGGQDDDKFIQTNALSREEKEKVSIALRDSSGSIGLGALTMLVMQKIKNIDAPKSDSFERYIIAFDL